MAHWLATLETSLTRTIDAGECAKVGSRAVSRTISYSSFVPRRGGGGGRQLAVGVAVVCGLRLLPLMPDGAQTSINNIIKCCRGPSLPKAYSCGLPHSSIAPEIAFVLSISALGRSRHLRANSLHSHCRVSTTTSTTRGRNRR